MPVIGESHTTLTAPRVWEVVWPPWRSGWTGLADVHLCARERAREGVVVVVGVVLSHMYACGLVHR